MPNIGLPGLIIILVVALLLFGPKKLPELGRAFGRTLREFKGATKGLLEDDEDKKEVKEKENNYVIEKNDGPSLEKKDEVQSLDKDSKQ